MKQNLIPDSFFSGNRTRLLKQIDNGAIVVMFSNKQQLRTGDQYYPYRQNSDFFYLTGIEQAESILLLDPNNSDTRLREILFLLVPDKKMEIYEDEKLSFDQAKTISGIKTIRSLSEFDEYLTSSLEGTNTIYSQLILEQEGRKFIDPNLSALSAQKLFEETTSKVYKSIIPITTALRLIKQPIEVELMQKACDITNEVFNETISKVVSGMYEYEIDAILQYGFAKRGIKALSFEPIIASGENALRLHYTKKDKKCNEGELLLFDIGCEYHNYCSDCSRTIPVNGKFTERQRECYNAVLDVYEKAKKLFVKGNTIAEINQNALIYMAEKLLDLGLITPEQYKDEEQRKLLAKKYLPHGISHFVGLDTHDVGASNIPLEKGMVLTCEPGIYIQEEAIGIRIETMLLITDNEPFDFFPDTCLSTKEIENAMNHR